MYEYYGTLVKDVDGDTVDVIVDLGFHASIKERFRMLIVDTPERGEVGYKEANQFTIDWFAKNPKFIIKTYKNEDDNWGRWLGEFFSIATGESLSKLLLDSGHAVIYKRA